MMKAKVKLAGVLAGIIFAFIMLWVYEGYTGETPGKSLAMQILNATGVKGGLIVHLNCGDGKLTAGLYAGKSYLVHGLDRDSKNVQKARAYIRSLGLYGEVSVDHLVGEQLPYVDNLVNLLVSEKPLDVSLSEVMRVLVPNGVAYIKEGNKWRKIVKPMPKEIDEWTHYLHDATNNAVSNDTVVGLPYHIQWVSGPKWTRSHDHLNSISAVVSSGGRIFYIIDEGPTASVAMPPRWSLVARDAYNGVLLWKRPIGPWEGHLRGFRSGPPHIARRLVAVKDRVYVTLGYGSPVSALDAATGKLIRTYKGTDGAVEIVYENGVLFIVAGSVEPEEAAVAAIRPFGPRPPMRNKRLMAIKADTGKLLWKKFDRDTYEIMPATLAVSEGRVFFQNTRCVVCLSARKGKVIWRAWRPVATKRPAWSTSTLVVYGDVVLSADRATLSQEQEMEKGTSPDRVEWFVTSRGGVAPIGELVAFSAKTGKRLWSSKCREGYNAPVDVLVVNGLVWTGNLVRANDPGITEARDVKTGEVKFKRPPDKEFYTVGMTHHRCHRNRATVRYIITGRAGVEFIDVRTGKVYPHHWIRGTCQYGIMTANGLLYVPPHSCACFIKAKLSGFYAFAPRRDHERVFTADELGYLERGRAYDQVDAIIARSKISAEDCPTYRCDVARSGWANCTVPIALKQIWRAPIGGRLTSPIAANGKVFIASVDTHTVYALDANSGEVIWTYTAGGRVDSPPTFYRGLLIFGCRDGYVYCLRASDGELVWRFRAAPQDRRIVAHGQLESVWPVHGSVLIVNDVLYFVAGRSSYLDNGIFLYRLDPKTGEKLSVTHIDSRDPVTEMEPRDVIRGTNMPGALPDILSSDGSSIFMRHSRFDLNGVPQKENVPHLFSPAGFLDDSWWHRTYWIIGTRMASGWGGWPIVGNTVHSGRLLVIDEFNVYGFGRESYATHGSHPGLGRTHYQLFAASRELLPPPKPKARKKRRARPPVISRVKYLWTKRIPVIVRAMVLADKTLFIAGPPNSDWEGMDALMAWEGKRNALLWVISASNGKKLAEYRLPSPPVFDGMIAAMGRLFICTQDGKVICLGGT